MRFHFVRKADLEMCSNRLTCNKFTARDTVTEVVCRHTYTQWRCREALTPQRAQRTTGVGWEGSFKALRDGGRDTQRQPFSFSHSPSPEVSTRATPDDPTKAVEAGA